MWFGICLATWYVRFGELDETHLALKKKKKRSRRDPLYSKHYVPPSDLCGEKGQLSVKQSLWSVNRI